MKGRALLVIMVLGMLMMGSCRSHKSVVGSDGQVIPDQVVNVAKPELAGSADNQYTRALVDEAYAWLGTPYRWGGETRQGADCSGFTMQVYDTALGIKLPRVSRDQGDVVKQARVKDLIVGDLLFFVTGGNGLVSHVGIYLGNNKMIHSSSSKGVCVSDITNKYWTEHYDHSGYVEEYRKLISGKNKKGTSDQRTQTPEQAPNTPVTSSNTTQTAPQQPAQQPVSTKPEPAKPVEPMVSPQPDTQGSATQPSGDQPSRKSRVKRY